MNAEKREEFRISETRVLKYVILATLPFAMILPLVQVWGHYYWLLNDSDRCDFPECLVAFYPNAISKLELFWSGGVALGMLLIICSALLRDGRAHTLRIGTAASASFLAICLTPIHPGWKIDSLSDGQAFVLRGPYALALAMLLLAAVLNGWELITRTRGRQRGPDAAPTAAPVPEPEDQF